jgi:hypothetical protein
MTNKEDMQDLLAKINAPNQTFNPSQLSMWSQTLSFLPGHFLSIL